MQGLPKALDGSGPLSGMRKLKAKAMALCSNPTMHRRITSIRCTIAQLVVSVTQGHRKIMSADLTA
jgi:hypothetical protein